MGTVLNDKWTLERLVGVGGMAAVYAGRHRNGARAAVKVLHPELARYKDVRERFQREGYAANKVNHPGVVKVLDDDVVSGGADAGIPYLVMELLEGESLQDRLERGVSFGEREFLDLASDVLEVLQAAHKRGVIHRDLKPENLFFARNEGSAGKTRVKVLDFGLARLLDSQAITTYGLALGTPSFMAPEQAAGRVDEIDGRTDLFALAATGFRLRTGRRIHEADSPAELVAKMARLPAPRIGTVAADVSAPFARVIDRALEFKREDRYESATAMRADVQRARAELDAGARLPSPDGRAPSPRRQAKVRPGAAAAEPTIEVSASDLERPPVYGLDESIRIPKRRSFLPWLALLLAGGAAAAVWRDDARRSWIEGTLSAWRASLGGSTASSVVDAGASPTPNPSARATGDAGAARAPAGAGARTTPAPSGVATHHPLPPKPAASGAPKPSRPPGTDP